MRSRLRRWLAVASVAALAGCAARPSSDDCARYDALFLRCTGSGQGVGEACERLLAEPGRTDECDALLTVFFACTEAAECNAEERCVLEWYDLAGPCATSGGPYSVALRAPRTCLGRGCE